MRQSLPTGNVPVDKVIGEIATIGSFEDVDVENVGELLESHSKEYPMMNFAELTIFLEFRNLRNLDDQSKKMIFLDWSSKNSLDDQRGYGEKDKETAPKKG